MWEPADVNALPTIQDRIDAILAIQTLEIDLKDAVRQPADAQLRIDAIEKNLEERKAWIAPVRKLSLDVLSLIFEFCGEDDWKTALRIAAVSRQWRCLALSTPRAWSFVDLKECDDAETADIFFQRSGQLPLHIFLPDHKPLAFLSNSAHRLQCLSIYRLSFDANELFFPMLIQLSIRVDDSISTVRISDLGVARFPALLHLVCESNFVMETFASIGGTSHTVAPLQNLSLVMPRDLGWLNFLKLCKDTLVSLSLRLVYRPTTAFRTTVVLPKLKCLHIEYWEEDPDLWPLDLVTTALEKYQELSDAPHTIPIHQDVKNVTIASLDRALNLSIFPKLVILQLNTRSYLFDVLSQLLSDDRLCPELKLIEAASFLKPVDLDNRIRAVNKHRKAQEITVGCRGFIPVTGIMTASPCGTSMPCIARIFSSAYETGVRA